MNEFNPEYPPLENLSWPAEPPRDDLLRQSLLETTSQFVRGRRYRRRLRLVASWSAAYAAGLATALLVWRSDRPTLRPAAERAAPQAAVERVAADQVAIARLAARASDSRLAVETPPEELSPEELSPEELRSRVLGAPRPEQIRLLRLAGDRYLYGRADVASALDCYRQVIELTPPAKLAERHQEDSWLLAELKSSAASLTVDDK